MSASIIIRAYNESTYLPSLLSAIQKQQTQPSEIILVDSGSTDTTVDIARGYGCRIVPIESRDFTFGYALNVGIAAATAEHIVIVSAHTEPTDDQWLGKILAPFGNPDVAIVYGRQVGVASSKIGEYFDFQRTYGRFKLDHVFANNANSAIRRSLWAQRPFDEDILGLEDIEWTQYWVGQGYRTAYAPDAGIYHIHTETWRQVWRRYYRESVSATTIRYWKKRMAAALAASELYRFLQDLYYVMVQRDATPIKGGPVATLRELVLFRACKGGASVAGLFGKVDLRDPATRHRLFFDREIAAWKYHNGQFLPTAIVPQLLRPTNLAVEAKTVAVFQNATSTELVVFAHVLEAGSKTQRGAALLHRYVAFIADTAEDGHGKDPVVVHTDQIPEDQGLLCANSLDELYSEWVELHFARPLTALLRSHSIAGYELNVANSQLHWIAWHLEESLSTTVVSHNGTNAVSRSRDNRSGADCVPPVKANIGLTSLTSFSVRWLHNTDHTAAAEKALPAKGGGLIDIESLLEAKLKEHS